MKQQKKQASIPVFYSYASADRQWRDQLAVHLSQLKHDGLIEELYDDLILAGKEHSPEQDRMLRSAQIILLLITADFLASDACYRDEMQHALERHRTGGARVVPIIVRPCDWQHSPFAPLQCLPRNGKPIVNWENQDDAFLAIVQALRRIITQQEFPPPLLSQAERQSRVRLLKQVRTTWIDGLLTQSLHHEAGIELCLQDRPDVLANPWRLQIQEWNQAPQALPEGTSLVQVYDSAEGELLILGEPGAGKTTLLLELTRILLDRVEADERLPMPVVFNLSSWAEKRQLLRAWLVEELQTKYQIPHKIGQGWVDTDQVLPLLDGLDEVAEKARRACVEVINDYYQSRLERGRSLMVVCCRREEYAALSAHVLLQHAVSILPLTDAQINTYLEQAGEQVAGLRQALNEDPKLHELARQPLMLNIFLLAYQGARASEVPTSEGDEEARQIIFARYVERMLNRRKQSGQWKPGQTIHWLTFLAKQMQEHSWTIFFVDGLQFTWLPDIWFWGAFVFDCLLVGLPIGVSYALIAATIERGLRSSHVLDNALNFGGLGMLMGGCVYLVYGRIRPRVTRIGGRGAAFALIFGLVNGALFGLLVGVQQTTLPVMLLAGLILGGFVGLLSWLFTSLLVLPIDQLKHWILRFVLSRRGNLPWNPAPFLDEAAERLLLRKVGKGYIFVHQLLLEYFVSLDRPKPISLSLEDKVMNWLVGLDGKVRSWLSETFRRKT